MLAKQVLNGVADLVVAVGYALGALVLGLAMAVYIAVLVAGFCGAVYFAATDFDGGRMYGVIVVCLYAWFAAMEWKDAQSRRF